MAELFYFFNSTLNDRRQVFAQHFADFFGDILSSGLLHTDNNPGLQVTVEAGTLNTIVDTGKAIMKGHRYVNTTPLTLEHRLPEPDQDRIDRIVLRLDLRHNERYVRLFVKDGVPAVNPVAPTLQRDANVYEISLARIRVRANTVQLQQSDLVDERLNEDVCGVASSLITVPTNVFNQQFQLWLDENQTNFEQWFTDNQQAFLSWFETIRGILNEDVAGNLLLLIQKNESDIKSMIKMKRDVLVPANGWTLNSTASRYEYDINDVDITADSVVDVNIQLDYLDNARSLMSACVSSNGYVTLYSTEALDNDLVVDYRITRQVV